MTQSGEVQELVLTRSQLAELDDIYHQLQVEYERVAGLVGLTCSGCPDNCCDSFFLHHTYIEWAYLWVGLRRLPPADGQRIVERAGKWLLEVERARAENRHPQVMCPCNEGGRCLLYQHRLLVCRTHGVPAALIRPDGQAMHFPGCFRCQEMVRDGAFEPVPEVNRTAPLQRLARLENELFDGKRRLYPKIKLTIAEMIVKGPPSLPVAHCRRGLTRGSGEQS